MALVLNTNIASLNSQKNLSRSQGRLNTAIQRLSSGLRINSAKDDAAGLAISSRMTAQIAGLNQAARNANDGISLAQTAEGAMDEITNNLQRIRELAVQSSNSTNSASDRAALQAEASQLISEIDRVASQTAFNGVNLLDGTFTSKSFQVGANASQTINITSITSAKANSLGVGSSSSYSTSITNPTAVTTGVLTAGGITINGYDVGASTADGVSSTGDTYSAISKANAINAITGDTGVTATVDATTVANTATASGTDTVGASINGVLIGTAGAVALTADANVAATEMVSAINAVSSQTGVTASYTEGAAGYTLTASDGRNITVAVTTAGASGLSAATTTGSINLSSSSSTGITIGGADVAYAGLTAAYTAATATAGAGVSSLDLTTASGASSAITTVDAALDTINSSRGDLGAYQNRFESVVANLQSTSENVSASRSRIVDADYAAETANLTKASITQQAGVAMLAQANSLPQTILSLLG